ncbi:MAG: YqaA family protein [Candidatus Tectimicrobiota bacterium]
MADLAPWVTAYGLLGLTLAAFLAATLLPFSSEIAVLAALHLGFAPLDVLVWASLGNCLGALSNYGLGYWLAAPLARRVLRERWGRQAWAWASRYGGWSLAMSWLPLVGDPVMLVGGILRFHPAYVLVLGLGTRVLRYICLIGLISL